MTKQLKRPSTVKAKSLAKPPAARTPQRPGWSVGLVVGFSVFLVFLAGKRSGIGFIGICFKEVVFFLCDLAFVGEQVTFSF